MKKLLISLLSVSLLLTPIIVTTGCTITQRKVAYQTLAGVGLATQKSMQSVAEARAKGLVTLEDWERVAFVHDIQYLPAYNAACDLAANDLSQLAPADVLALSQSVILTVEQILRK